MLERTPREGGHETPYTGIDMMGPIRALRCEIL